jgi:hypothetical protein
LNLADNPNPGVWCRLEDAGLTAPSAFHDGRVGDLLAVSSTKRCQFLDEILGKLVALRQHSKITHLGVVRTADNLQTTAFNCKALRGAAYQYFIWLEVLAIDPTGFVLPTPYSDTGFSFNTVGGHYNRIAHQDFAAHGGSAAELRDAIWAGFSCIRSPGPLLSCTRGAIRP